MLWPNYFKYVFPRLYQKYQDDTSEGVLYRMLLHSLGVADLPKELTVLASIPSSRGSQREEKKQADFSERYCVHDCEWRPFTAKYRETQYVKLTMGGLLLFVWGFLPYQNL